MLFLLMNVTKCCTVSSPKKECKHYWSLLLWSLLTSHVQIVDLALNLTKSHGSYDPLQSSEQERWWNKEKMEIRDIFQCWVGGYNLYMYYDRVLFCFVSNHALTLPNHEALISLLVLLKSSHQGRVHVCHFTTFEPMEQKLLNLEWNLSLKIN